MSYFAILQISCKMEHNCKIKLNIFEKQTAYLNDFTKHPVPRRIKYRWPRNVSESQGKPCKIYNREDHHTFQRLKEDKHVPFDLWWKRKPITRTDPRHKFQLPVSTVTFTIILYETHIFFLNTRCESCTKRYFYT